MTASRASWAWKRQIAAVALTIFFLFPLVYMLTGSLRKPGLPPPRTPELVPAQPSLEAYDAAFELVDLARYTLNSLFVAAVVVPLTVLFASLAGFSMSWLSARRARALLAASLIALMVPLTALIVPRFALFSTLGLTDSYWPLIIPTVMGLSPFYVLIYYWSFRRLPRELIEAARLEGLSPLRIWRRVAMPLVRPVTTAVALLAFVFTWGNFLDPLIYLFDERLFTLPLGLRSLAQLDRQNFPLLLAGSVTATLPVLIAFLYLQRFFLHDRPARWVRR